MSDDFQRHPRTGAPYVNHPTEVTDKGRPRRVMYGRPSNFGLQVESTFGLLRWSERMTLIGATQLDLEPVKALDPESADDRDVLDGYVVDAKAAAGAYLSAQRGTFTHSLTETLDRAEESPLSLIAAGESLGMSSYVCDALMAAWDALLDRAGLTILGVEQRCVHDRWRLAGTLDRIARCNRDLHFGRVTIPAGTVLVLDVKTGRVRLIDGHPRYWHSYAVQIATYAGAVPYLIDGLDEQRAEWPWPISQRHALIGHLDVANAIEEDVATATLWHVDLVEGRAAGNLARSARDWQNRRGIFHERNEPPVAVTVRYPI